MNLIRVIDGFDTWCEKEFNDDFLVFSLIIGRMELLLSERGKFLGKGGWRGFKEEILELVLDIDGYLLCMDMNWLGGVEI